VRQPVLVTGGFSGPSGGLGRVRLDGPDNNFGGQITGVASLGFQPIIIAAQGQGVQLAIQTIGGLSVGVNPSSAYNNPAAVLPASQPNPVPVVVRCSNVPLGTQIFLNARSAVGQTAASSGYNNSGTLASSAATIAINLPRGTGILMAQAVISSGQGLSAQTSPNTPEHAVVEAATAKTKRMG